MPAKVASLATTSSGRAAQAVLAQLVDLPTDGRGPPGDLGLVGPQQTTWAAENAIEAGSRPAASQAVRHHGELPAGVVEGPEGQVELGGVAGGQARGPLGAASADDDRGAGPLHRLGQGRAVGQLVVAARRRRRSRRPASPTGR